MNVTFRPIEVWPDQSVDPNGGPRSISRERSLFRSSWSQTLELLEYELYRLGADSVVISMALGSKDIRQDGWPRKKSRPSHPGVILEFQTRNGWQRYYGDDYDKWEHNVHDIAKLLEDLRAVGLRRAAKGRQYQGFKAIGSGRPEQYAGGPVEREDATMTREEAARFLSDNGGIVVTPDHTSPSAVGRSYRRASRKLHPDVGGAPGEFEKLQRARDILLGGEAKTS